MPRSLGSAVMRLVVCAPALALFAAMAQAQSAVPWDVETVYKNGVFDRCALTRELDDGVSVSFVRAGEALELVLTSPHWKLDAGESYPVTLKLGPRQWDRDMSAETNTVSMAVEDARLKSGLRAANMLDVIAAGDTIRVPLEGSRAAFERLDRCVATNTGPSQETVAAGDEPPPPPATKPDAGPAEPNENAVSDAVETVPPPVEKPEIDLGQNDEAEDARQSAVDEAIAQEDEPPPPAAKPENAPVQPAAKKASPKPKPAAQSSAQTVKRAFEREVNRLRRFFGN